MWAPPTPFCQFFCLVIGSDHGPALRSAHSGRASSAGTCISRRRPESTRGGLWQLLMGTAMVPWNMSGPTSRSTARRRCVGGAGQHVLHPQASECVSEKGAFSVKQAKTLCGLPPAPHVYPPPRKTRPPWHRPGHARRQPVSGSGLPAAERFGSPGHGGYQHVQPAEQAG